MKHRVRFDRDGLIRLDCFHGGCGGRQECGRHCHLLSEEGKVLYCLSGVGLGEGKQIIGELYREIVEDVKRGISPRSTEGGSD